MQAHLAFQRVEGAFAFCIGAYPKIAEWKAIMDRLAQFEAAMKVVDTHRDPHAQIAFVPTPGPDLTIDNLVVRLGSGDPIATVPAIKLAPGEGLLVSGQSGSGKSSLFRALAGLWPLGDGAIKLPETGRVLALPQRPYFPLGTLRQALTYPTLAGEVDDAALRDAMAAAGLIHLVSRLDEEAEWATVLSGGEQQRVAFARALIARPVRAAARRGRHHAGGKRSARALPHAGRAAARNDRHLDRPRGPARARCTPRRSCSTARPRRRAARRARWPRRPRERSLLRCKRRFAAAGETGFPLPTPTPSSKRHVGAAPRRGPQC